MKICEVLGMVFVVSLCMYGSSARSSGVGRKVLTREIPFRVIDDDDVKAFNGLNTIFEPKRYASIKNADILRTTFYGVSNRKGSKTKSVADKEKDDGNKPKQDGNDDVTKSFSLTDESTTWDDSSTETNSSLLARIVGGTFSSPASWPWQVSIQYLGEDMFWYHHCGGTLVDSKWIVTAAHCVIQLEYCTVRTVLGDYRLSDFADTEEVINPTRMTMHGFYNDTTKDYYYDIALIELEKEADINNYVQTVPMVTSKKDTFNRHDICYIAGWGNIIGSVFDIQMSDYLQQSRMTVLSLDECRATYGNGIIETQICVQSHHSSACLGDSGSPLVCASGQIWMLVGIASWVGSSTCSPSYPSVYTRISSFEHWVRSVMGQAEYY